MNESLDGGESLASRPGRFTTRENVRGIHRIHWVDPTAGVDDMDE
jgi:hypothetical protein